MYLNSVCIMLNYIIKHKKCNESGSVAIQMHIESR